MPAKNKFESFYDVNKRKGDIAILGGSFNPIHNGHIAMAEAAHKQLGLDVVLMPNKTTYYKENKVFAPDEDRLNMLKLVAEDKEYIYYSDLEIKRGGVTHTIDTIRDFKDTDPDRTVYFIIGGDSLEWVDKWVDADILLSMTHFVTAVRGETDKTRSQSIIERLTKEFPESHISLLDMDSIAISSSDIRHKVSDGISIDGLVPDDVKDYINDNKLYKE